VPRRAVKDRAPGPEAGPKRSENERSDSFWGASADELWLIVRHEMRAHRTVLVIVDELQNLTIDRDCEISVDAMKDLSNSSAAAFVYVGVKVSRTKLLAGDRGRHIAGRVTGVSVIPYLNATGVDKAAPASPSSACRSCRARRRPPRASGCSPTPPVRSRSW
jgi:hypothetical protein